MYLRIQHIHLHLQGKFLHLSSRLSHTFCATCSQSQHILSISDGSSQLPAHPRNAKGWGPNPPSYPPEPGRNQPWGHLLLSLDTYAPYAAPLPRWPVHPPRQGHVHAPSIWEAPELSRTTAILLVFRVDSRHKRITNVYMGLVVHRVDSRLYSPSQIHDFIKDIEDNLQAVHNALKAGGNPGKRHAYCLFVDNLSGAMSNPTDPPYCLVYPTSYIKGIEPDHFDTHNSPVGMRLHCCVCHATLQFSNDGPKQHTKYIRSRLILPDGAQYNEWLYPSILSQGTTAAC